MSGPTKTGKTVLIRHVVPDALVVEGGHVRSFDEFVGAVLDHFNVPTSYEHSAEDERSEGRDRLGHLGSSNLVSVQQKNSETSSDKTGVKQTSNRSSVVAARETLLGGSTPLVIDDFHYIAPNVQLEVVRFLKGLIFEGLPVIFVSVPHRAYDVVRVEREMTGRMKALNVGFWSDDELPTIPRQGFSALNVFDSNNAISRRLASETFSSPHLMQQFCLRICEENEVAQTIDQLKPLREPGGGWSPFFRNSASSSSKSTFDHLARGPRQRSDRISRTLHDGRQVDIYGVVLEAIADTGPLISITYEELRTAVRRVIASDPPQRHEITRVLEEMTKIAKEKIEGEPVVDWDSAMETLHISDPYFAYYLRWGTRETVELRSSTRRSSAQSQAPTAD